MNLIQRKRNIRRASAIVNYGLINACEITDRKIEDVKVVLNGPGAAGIATLELIKAMGVRHENVIAVDSKGVLYKGRSEGTRSR